jgi:putative nucleotidyltransferase with HDIG domain
MTIASSSKHLDLKLRQISDLPALPTALQRVIGVLDDPMSSTNDLESALILDPGLTLKVIKLANSAYYAIPGGSASLARCISFLGQGAIYQIVLASSIFSALQIRHPDFNLDQFWRHSVGTAVLAQRLADIAGLDRPELAFLGGLIHDTGKLALLHIDSTGFWKTIQAAKEAKVSLFEWEKAQGLMTHAEVGAALGQHWRLPPELIAIIRYHHQLDRTRRIEIFEELSPYIDAVALANEAVRALSFGFSGNSMSKNLPHGILRRLQVKPDALPQLFVDFREDLARAELLCSALVAGIDSGHEGGQGERQ